jgi:hydrogenase nickel incorporation protein HypA/HybF
MHESSIVRDLLSAAAESAGQKARVLEVHVEVGRLTGVSPDAMEFYFDVLRDETLGPQARLDVRLLPLRGGCGACGARVEKDELSWTCASCGGPLVFENGSELNLTSLVVERE